MLMANNYTENELLLYLYNELSELESAQIESALLSNSSLQNSLSKLKEGIAVLEKLGAEPSPTSIELIMEYSQQSAAQLEEA